jgi:predicted acylesterase/phospholipase RssA
MRITLCLSGGGFRATIFHLGVLDFLVQTDRLQLVDSVYGVSGGAITAAHFAHRSTQYNDPTLFHEPALDLLQLCNKGLIARIAWANLYLQRPRSSQLTKEVAVLFGPPIATQAKPTYLICSALNDTSQYAVELKSRHLYRLEPNMTSANDLGKTRLTTQEAAAMSSSFPLVFEPLRLNPLSTGLDQATLGDDKLVADGGIVDNYGIAMAQCLEKSAPDDQLFLISDASQIFDRLDRDQEKIATILSPLRSIDYLMTRNAAAIMNSFREKKRGKIAAIKLTDARSVGAKVDGVSPSLLHSALRIRTNFDSFSIQEILTLYRLGIMVANATFESLPKTMGVSPVNGSGSLNTLGLISDYKLAGQALNVPWKDLVIKPRRTSVSRVADYLFRKPGFILVAVLIAIFLIALCLGFILRGRTQLY